MAETCVSIGWYEPEFFLFENHMESIHAPEIFWILLLVPFLQDNVLIFV